MDGLIVNGARNAEGNDNDHNNHYDHYYKIKRVTMTCVVCPCSVEGECMKRRRQRNHTFWLLMYLFEHALVPVSGLVYTLVKEKERR